MRIHIDILCEDEFQTFFQLILNDPDVNRMLGDPGSKLTVVKLLHYGKADVAY